MENKLDKYFKDNLHDRKFEMKEDYWLAAEKLLDAQDERRKRRVFFWWFNAGAGLLLLAGLAWFILGKNGQVASSKPTSEPTMTTSKPNSPETTIAEQNPALEIAEANTNEVASSSTIKQKTAGNAMEMPVIVETANQRKAVHNQAVTSKIKHSTLASVEMKSDSKNVQFQSEAAQTGHTENKAMPTMQVDPMSAIASLTEQVVAPDILAARFAFLDYVTEKPLVKAINDKIEPVKTTWFHIGIVAAQMLQPNPAKDENMRLGNQLGLALKYDLNADFYLASGINYAYRTGHFDATKQAEQRNYRFGLELDTLLLRPTSLHYIGIPLALGWQHNRHNIEAGIQLDYLAGVRGETGSIRKQGEPPVKVFVADKKGWVTADGYRRITPTLQMGYNFRIARMFAVGLTANYTLGGILDPNYKPNLNSYLLKESDKFFVNLKAIYFFN